MSFWTVTTAMAVIGRARAIGAIGPLGGALLATTISQQMATAMNAPDVAVFVMIGLVLQMLIGLPIASVCLKQYIKAIRANGELAAYCENPDFAAPKAAAAQAEKKQSAILRYLESDYWVFFKISVVAASIAVGFMFCSDFTHKEHCLGSALIF